MVVFNILKMKKNKIIKNCSLILLFILFSIILTFNAYAGVSSPYWDENPLYVYPEEVKEFNYLLQNMVGDNNITIQATLEPGTTIMEFVDQNTLYNVPLGSSNTPVRMRIIVPGDAQLGQEWQVGVRFTQVPGNAEGPLTIGAAYSKGFKVIVGKPEPSESVSGKVTKPIISSQIINFLILIIALVALWLVVSYFYKKANK